MIVKVGLLFVLLFVGNCVCDAMPVAHSDLSVSAKKVDVCTLCEEYASFALDYLNENKTQEEIVEALHEACSELHTLKEQCITLADYYAALFFTQLSNVQPDTFCEKVNLCHVRRNLPLRVNENHCDVCHHAVDEIILKLKDPETKFDVVEILLRGCDAVEDHWKKAKKCKVMVHKYTPIILTKAEKYLEKTDICAPFHGCSPPSTTIDETRFDAKITMVTSS